jgi:hypothetical protein
VLGARRTAERAGISHAAVERVQRRSTEEYVVALLLKHPDLTRDIVERVPTEELNDARNRELVKVLQDGAVAGMTAEQIVVGLDDQLADHAEYLLATLDGRPEQFPGQIHRECEEMLVKLGKERYEFLMRQLDSTLKTAIQENDRDALETVKEQLGRLAERHRQFYPPPSPYFLDSRSPNRR